MLFVAKDIHSTVSSDSYTGQVYYEREGYNRWQMKFIVIQDIDAFVKVYIHVLLIHYMYIMIGIIIYSIYLKNMLTLWRIK